jgi:hypothetical protein
MDSMLMQLAMLSYSSDQLTGMHFCISKGMIGLRPKFAMSKIWQGKAR